MNTTMHPTALAVLGSGAAGNGTAEQQRTPFWRKLVRLFSASGVEPAIVRGCRTLALVASSAFVLDVSSFITSMFQARKALKYLLGILDMLLGGSLLFVALYGALTKDGRYTGIYVLGSTFKCIYEVVQIVFGVFAVQTLEEELSRVEETQADPNDLQFQVALCILHVLLDAADCVAYCCSSVASLLLREQILSPVLELRRIDTE